MAKIIQFNCNSLGVDKALRGPMVAEIRRELNEHAPHILIPLETKLKKKDPTPHFPGFEVHRADRSAGEADGGGIMILVAEGVQWTAKKWLLAPESCVGTEAAGVRIYQHNAKPFDVVAIYNRPKTKLQFDPAWIGARAHVFGDLDLHNRAWDKTCSDRTIADDAPVTRRRLAWVENNGRTILSDGRPTYSSGSKKSAAAGRVLTLPDLTITAPGTTGAKWIDLLDWGSDDYAIVSQIPAGGPLLRNDPPRLRLSLKKADWAGFTTCIEEQLSVRKGANADVLNKVFVNAVLKAAHKFIGQSKGKGKKSRIWWCKETEDAVQWWKMARKKAEKTGAREHIAAWRREERLCKNIIRRAKARAWQDFASKLDKDADLNQVWRVRHSLSGKGQAKRKMPPLVETSTTEDGEKKTDIITTGRGESGALRPRLRSGVGCYPSLGPGQR